VEGMNRKQVPTESNVLYQKNIELIGRQKKKDKRKKNMACRVWNYL
jgi:hypothetical protein